MMCVHNKWLYIDNDNIDDSGLTSDNIHLNGYGYDVLKINTCKGISELTHSSEQDSVKPVKDKRQYCKSIFAKDFIDVVLLNARSIKCVNKRINKLVQLQNVTESTNCDIFGITETWLNDRVNGNGLFL